MMIFFYARLVYMYVLLAKPTINAVCDLLMLSYPLRDCFKLGNRLRREWFRSTLPSKGVILVASIVAYFVWCAYTQWVAMLLYIDHLLWAGVNFCHLWVAILWTSFSTANHLLYNFNQMLTFHSDGDALTISPLNCWMFLYSLQY